MDSFNHLSAGSFHCRCEKQVMFIKQLPGIVEFYENLGAFHHPLLLFRSKLQLKQLKK